MKHAFFALLVLIAVVPATATAAPVNGTEAAPTDDNRTGRPIDPDTSLLDARIEDGDAVLILASNGTQTVSFVDAASVMRGGEVPVATRTLRDGRNRIVLRNISTFRNTAAVTINTGETLFAVQLKASDPLIGGPFTARDAQMTALSAAAAVGAIAIVMVIRYLRGTTHEPERIA